uniref:Rho GTPase-activating protein 5-like n=1 Tax=Saccoglossus kowalevskii TaxID=10224 RepID=A0ABM0MPF2_SACKO|nr:PREDICTED: rho GTPase-activating protein 5-like [Saccoglossus kowalevskii]
MAKKTDKSFNIAVVGLSGTDKDKGALGVGKSCLCNRFVSPHADSYATNHISILSQTDFSGRVVNNDHFLYWGEVYRQWDDDELTFHIIEQTEFIDDTSFQPLRGTNTAVYHRRCTGIRLHSAEKLMYICKDQLALEHEYPQKQLPDGKINIDGFLCVFDVSNVSNRTLDQQTKFLDSVLSSISKTKKPVVIATTKCDEGFENYRKEAEKYASSKKVQIVETSAHENVNVDTAFLLLAQNIDKKIRVKNTPYSEASKHQKQLIDSVTEKYSALLKSAVEDCHTLWKITKEKFVNNRDYLRYVDVLGEKSAHTIFRKHIRLLKDTHQTKKLVHYLNTLPKAFEELLPDLETIDGRPWQACHQIILNHPNFDKWFVKLGVDENWKESDFIHTEDPRIPYDVLTRNEQDTEMIFRNHINKLNAEEKKSRMRLDFKKLLEKTGTITPGKPFDDVIIFLMGDESYRLLDEQDKKKIYHAHQRELAEGAKEDFRELLFEHSELFAKLDSNKNVSKEDLKEIHEALKREPRYAALSLVENDRDVLLLRHIGFVHNPRRETCLSADTCMDNLVEKCFDGNAHRPSSWNRHSSYVEPNNKLNVVLLGADGLADELANEIRSQSCEEDYTLDGSIHSLDLKTILQCAFVDMPKDPLWHGKRFHDAQITQSFRAIIATIRIRSGLSGGENNREIMEPDIKIQLCMMCGDPYPADLVLGPLVNHQCCWINPDKAQTIALDTFLGSEKRKVEVMAVSYHQATTLKQDLHHGYILAYSAKRKASFSMLKAFSQKVTHVPILIVAVTDTDMFFSDSDAQKLVTEGNKWADELKVKFITASAKFRQQAAVFTSFFKESFDKKSNSEAHFRLIRSLSIESVNTGPVINMRTRKPEPLPPGTRLSLYNKASDYYDVVTPPPKYNTTGRPPKKSKDAIDLIHNTSIQRRPPPPTPPSKPPRISESPHEGWVSNTIYESIDPISTKSVPPWQHRPLPHSLPPGDGPYPTEDIEIPACFIPYTYTVNHDEKLQRKKKGKEEKELEKQRRREEKRQREEEKKKQKEEEKRKRDERRKKQSVQAGKGGGTPSVSYNYFGESLEDIVTDEERVPLFVVKCVEYLEEQGLTAEGLYRVPGKAIDSDLILQKFDEDNTVNIAELNVGVNAVATALKFFFSELPEPVIPVSMQRDFLEAVGRQDDTKLTELKRLLGTLPHANADVFGYMMTHLNMVTQYSQDNLMNCENLSVCWWPTLLHPEFNSFEAMAQNMKMRDIIELFISKARYFFVPEET